MAAPENGSGAMVARAIHDPLRCCSVPTEQHFNHTNGPKNQGVLVAFRFDSSIDWMAS